MIDLIECFFSKLKLFRRITTRQDKLAEDFFPMVHSPLCDRGSLWSKSLRNMVPARGLEPLTP